MIEVDEPEEMLEFEACRGAWKLDDSLHMAREWPDSRGRNLMSQKLDIPLAKNRLQQVDGQTILTKMVAFEALKH